MIAWARSNVHEKAGAAYVGVLLVSQLWQLAAEQDEKGMTYSIHLPPDHCER